MKNLSSRAPSRSRARIVLLLALGLFAAAPAAHAQQPDARPTSVISANPFGLLLEWFNAEYERVVSGTATAGFGGSYFPSDGDDYLNLDGFWRLYPQGTPLDGWAFGAKAGITNVASSTYFGFGFDTNRSWILGSEDNFYVGIGFGLKRLVGVEDDPDFELRFIPTVRIVNIGYAF